MTDIQYTPHEIMLRRFYYAHGFFNAYDNVKQLTRIRPAIIILKDIAQWIKEQRVTSQSVGHKTSTTAESTERVQRARTHNFEPMLTPQQRAQTFYVDKVRPIPVRGTYPIE